MRDWNVVVTVRDGPPASARRTLRAFGPVDRSGFWNVLVMKVDDGRAMLERLGAQSSEEMAAISRVVPLTSTFNFHSPQEFEQEARRAVLALAPQLAGKSFHVRAHRRGFKGRLSSKLEEQQLDTVLLEVLSDAGTPGRIAFEDPDAIVAVEIVGTRAGIALWMRDDLQRYGLLGLD
jgi:tRNA(Ser,Leu) C12 N-acetylase TAN1